MHCCVLEKDAQVYAYARTEPRRGVPVWPKICVDVEDTREAYDIRNDKNVEKWIKQWKNFFLTCFK